jgi:hypothetical protein
MRTHPYRRMRQLAWPWLRRGTGELEVPALVVERIRRPGLEHHFHHLDADFAPLSKIEMPRFEFRQSRAVADRKLEAPA